MKDMLKRVLVTGSAGYIGSVLCKYLIDCGYKVTTLDKSSGDVRDESLMKKLLKGVDVIVLLAAVVGNGQCKLDPTLAREVNVNSVRMVNRLRKKTQLVIYTSTEMASKPTSSYARTKASAERELSKSENTIILRLASVFGLSPSMRTDFLVNYFVYTALTQRSIIVLDNEARRNYVHVRDVAEWIAYCIRNPKKFVGKKHYLAVDNLSKRELAMKIQRYVSGFSVKFSRGNGKVDERSYKAIQKGNFIARRSVNVGIRELVKEWSK